MSLSRKTLVLFLILGASFCLGSYAVLKLSVFPTFEEFELESAEEALSRVSRIVDADYRALEVMNVEYSVWDHTYAYAIGQMPEYAEENLDPAYWHALNINLMIVVDADGNELFAHLSDPIDGTELSLQDELRMALEPGHPLITHQSESDSLTGLISLRSGVMQIASYPILTSKAKGPIAGSLIVGQSVTDERVQGLNQRASVDMAIFTIADSEMPPRVTTSMQRMLASGEHVLVDADEKFLRTYRVLTDIFGEPAAIVELTAPRRITEIGNNIIRTTLTALAVASAIFLVAALLFLQRLITRPIMKLTDQILAMRSSGDLRMDVDAARSDEIGVMAKEFGQLTVELNSARSDLEGARDEALAMSRTKSEFLARMSHEIRTPMNGVIGMTELLRDSSLDDKQQRFARTIQESAESLLHIINDILDISKIEAGKVELDVAPFNLRHLVEECLELLAESAHRKGLELACAFPADIAVHVRGDPVRLRQVLMNLTGNAIKFTKQGEVVVRVSTRDVDQGTGTYVFEVEDTGIGINPENSSKIFEPFTQEDGSNTRRYGGTGLGLSISRQLVELMGGEIGVREAETTGCVFWFTARFPEDQANTARARTGLLAGKKVLVVDDNETNREIMLHQLESWRMHVEIACSGQEALEILDASSGSRAKFDIMLLDMAMPGMDGLELAEAIRQINRYRHTPLIMVSSVSRANIDKEQSFTVPANWLAKPVRQARLHDSLLSLLSGQSVHEDPCDTPATDDSDPAADARRGLRILLVDDNDVNLIVAQGMLNALGYTPVIARNGLEAVAACKEQQFDIVMMDCQMPEMDGFEATQRIRDWEAERRRDPVPIIALTAHALQGDRERCLAAGMSDYLSKPFTRQQVRQLIEANTSANAQTTAGPSNQESESPSAGRILVVDDNMINLQVTQAMLNSLGHESETASNGDEALRVIGQRDFDLVLMDCHMPGRNGYDTAAEIRRREGRRTPIVALTADVMEGNRKRCIDSGMDDYVNKPFTQRQLILVLKRWLSIPGADYSDSVSVDADGFSDLQGTGTISSIDRDAIAEIRRLDPTPGADLVREIVMSYCTSSTKLMLQLRSAVAEQDTDAVEQSAHALKGGSGQLGATLLASLCDELIVSVRNDELQNLRAQVERTATEHCAVLAGLELELQKIAA